MQYLIILFVSIFIYNISLGMDKTVFQEKLEQDLIEYDDEIRESFTKRQCENNGQNDKDIRLVIQERDQQYAIIRMISEHVAKL